MSSSSSFSFWYYFKFFHNHFIRINYQSFKKNNCLRNFVWKITEVLKSYASNLFFEIHYQNLYFGLLLNKPAKDRTREFNISTLVTVTIVDHFSPYSVRFPDSLQQLF